MGWDGLKGSCCKWLLCACFVRLQHVPASEGTGGMNYPRSKRIYFVLNYLFDVVNVLKAHLIILEYVLFALENILIHLEHIS